MSPWRPLAAALAVAAAPEAMALEPFTEEAVARGLVYAIQAHPQEDGYLGFGCGFADLDGDGDADAVVLGAADGRVGLFENDGSGQFTDRSAGSGIAALSEASAFAAGDIDGDGDLDLYLTQVGAPNVLARNDGGFKFTDVAAAAGVADPGSGKAAAFGDYDGDGRLDLFVANYNGIVPGTEEMDDRLYHNLGGGLFEDVSAAQTVDDPGYGFQAVWFDYDRDGDVDLYLSNDRGHLPPLFRNNQLWRNDGGQLVNVSEGSGAEVALFSMGVACGDFDGNGWPDLYCTNVAGDPCEDLPGEGLNPLLLNQGDGTFIESSAAWGVDHCITSWGSIFFDFDNDGRQDLYVNNMFEPNSLYDCDGPPPCSEIGAAAQVTANDGASFGSAVADLEGDGDLDLLVNNLGGNVELFVNHEGELRSWLRLRMVDDGANPHGIGGSVEVTAAGATQLQEVMAGGNGYLGQNDLVAHFGLGAAARADQVVGRWPGGGLERTLTDLPQGWTWTLYPAELLGDADRDGSVLLADFVELVPCFEAAPFQPPCEVFDFDGASQVDWADYDAFLATFDGEVADCDGDEVEDMREILAGSAEDTDGDGIPDECEALFVDGFESGDTSAWSQAVP